MVIWFLINFFGEMLSCNFLSCSLICIFYVFVVFKNILLFVFDNKEFIFEDSFFWVIDY